MTLRNDTPVLDSNENEFVLRAMREIETLIARVGTPEIDV
jgi:DNA-directed RNA polymerase subunit K/omega